MCFNLDLYISSHSLSLLHFHDFIEQIQVGHMLKIDTCLEQGYLDVDMKPYASISHSPLAQLYIKIEARGSDIPHVKTSDF